jgi:hypothetical protein
MSFELTGRLIEKFEITQISDTFKKREFVVERVENTSGGMEFKDQIKFQLTQDRCGIIDSMDIDDEIRISFNIRGRKWEKDDRVSYFTNLEAWRIEKIAGTSEGPPIPSAPQKEEDIPPIDESDDLPF